MDFDELSQKKGRYGVTDVISALQSHSGSLATQEQKVADYVQTHLEDISTMTIAELAKHSTVSTPTVMRFCRTIGYKGFREFKLRLAQNLAVSLQYMTAPSGEAPVECDAAIDQVLGAIYINANAMRQQIDPEVFDRAKAAIARSSQLLFAGIGGGSSMVSQEAANRFFRLGIPSCSISDSYVLQMRAATLEPGDVLFLISASGEADAVVSAAEIASGYGATTICITKPNTRLAAVAHISIAIDLPEDPDIFKPTASRYLHLVLIDALTLCVFRDLCPRANDNMRRIRASLTAYHGRTGPQPLGD